MIDEKKNFKSSKQKFLKSKFENTIKYPKEKKY